MGEPIKIADLAKNMIRLAGLVPDRDIMIEYIGLRPGEKLYEELLIEGEGVLDTAYEKIKVCNNFNGIDETVLYGAIEQFNLLLKNSGDKDTAIAILKRLVPAFEENHYIQKIELHKTHNPKDEHGGSVIEGTVH